MSRPFSIERRGRKHFLVASSIRVHAVHARFDSKRVGTVHRYPESGRWYGIASHRDAGGVGTHTVLPGWFKSRKTAVAAVLRASERAKRPEASR